MSDCGRYIILYISKGAEPRNKLYYCDLENMEGRNITGVCEGAGDREGEFSMCI